MRQDSKSRITDGSDRADDGLAQTAKLSRVRPRHDVWDSPPATDQRPDLTSSDIRRRDFLGKATALLAATSAPPAALAQVAPATNAPASPPRVFDRKIKAGLVGCGGRGSRIAGLMMEFGGYELAAVADYFQERADKTGDAHGVPAGKRFSGLSGYRRLIDSGVEAVILEVPPYFFPEQAAAAVEAGLHVYMAKPVAVDVPGTLRIGDLARQATAKKRVFFVDYQIPTEPFNIEVARRIREGALGRLQMVLSSGYKKGTAGIKDKPLGPTIEDRLTDLVWVNDEALGGGYTVNYDIHSIDGVIWVLGKRPVAAAGFGGRFRQEAYGDSLDTSFVTLRFDDGLLWNHTSILHRLNDWGPEESLAAAFLGDQAVGRINYWAKAYVRGGSMHYAGGEVVGLYDNGIRRNLATFYDDVVGGRCANTTAQRSMDCTLTSILVRDVARRGAPMTMEELIRENRRLEANLKGLKT